MEDDEIELISGGDKLQEVAQVLQEFIRKNETTFTFPNLNGNNKRVILWAALFQHLQNKASAPIHTLCLAAIRVLSRDKSELENLICEKWITTLIERAGLYNFVGINEESMAPLELPQKEIAIEALKCLCNVAFNSEVARALCAHTSIAQGLIARLRIYKDIPFKEEIMLFDIKLLFILTALRQDIKMKIKDELHGMDYLICCLNEQLKEATPSGENSAMDQDQHFFFTDNQQAISCEILKSMFNLILRPGLEESISEADESMYLKLMPVLTSLLYTQTTNEDKLMELRSNVANLLTSVPPPFYTYLTPVLDPGETAEFVFEGKNMDALQSLVQLLQYRLTGTTNTKNQYENLSPILTVMNKAARGSRVARKFLRRAVLPPLRDVSRPPEHGGELRNQLCRLLTTPVSSVRDLVAEFLFVLCKEKVGRMVKYTGFGNAAGHLAQKGLLGGGGGGGRYSSSSDDSDTEEYLEAAPRIDPVVGCTRPPRANPFEGMSEEQKEYEAMKLVNLFDKMVSEGVVRPARVGPDGRPQAIDHVLELRDHPPNRPQS
ncbi:chaperone Ric-8A-like [Choristoneura fumiferana]|uniref:chaperone Ric-8A-like n=1 Tax=Choristoneura fumiferana TaxID=7141 RepID=UPI003D1599D2